jgi:hypothetical protein
VFGAITAEAFDAICATFPLGSVGYEAETNAKGERLIRIERVWADKLGSMRTIMFHPLKLAQDRRVSLVRKHFNRTAPCVR